MDKSNSTIEESKLKLKQLVKKVSEKYEQLLNQYKQAIVKYKQAIVKYKQLLIEYKVAAIQYIRRKQKSIIIGSTIGVFVLGSLFGLYYVNTDLIYHVVVDGQEIGIVSDKSIIEEWEDVQLNTLKEEYSNSKLNLNNEIVYVSERKFKADYNNNETLTLVAYLSEYEAPGISIIVDGVTIGAVDNQEIASSLLDKVKEGYMPTKDSFVTASSVDNGNGEETIIKDIEILEEVSFQEVSVTPENILSEEDMLVILKKGTLEEKIYTVQKGDTISEIANKFALTQEQLRKMNPSLKGEYIQIGDKLIVTALTPPVTVKTTENKKHIERIPYSVEYEYDNSMYVNESKVLVKGVEGSKLVEYEIIKENGNVVEKTILGEEMKEDSITKVVVKGTKYVPSKGSGTLSWPAVGGIITSPYGSRWGSFHSGIDISGVSDRTIKAADTGTITFAGWRGGYGNCVIISHGNGVQTLYGHLSSISVSDGSSIAKGQKIGVMGNTGNSFGVHLHFEVIVNGQHKNPVNYVGN